MNTSPFTPDGRPDSETGVRPLADNCDQCGVRITATDAAMGWPVSISGEYICPSCYGNEAFCAAGHTLRADTDSMACSICADGAK